VHVTAFQHYSLQGSVLSEPDSGKKALFGLTSQGFFCALHLFFNNADCVKNKIWRLIRHTLLIHDIETLWLGFSEIPSGSRLLSIAKRVPRIDCHSTP